MLLTLPPLPSHHPLRYSRIQQREISYSPRPFIEYFSKPLKPDDLEGRGGREGGLLTMLSILPVEKPCIREVTCGYMDGISSIMLRSQHLLLVEEEYRCKVVIQLGHQHSGLKTVSVYKFLIIHYLHNNDMNSTTI